VGPPLGPSWAWLRAWYWRVGPAESGTSPSRREHGRRNASHTPAAQLVVPVPCPDDPPHDGVLIVGFVVQARDDLLPTVAGRGRLVRGREVAGGAVEEDAGAAFAVDPVHPPRCVQPRALRVQDDAHAQSSSAWRYRPRTRLRRRTCSGRRLGNCSISIAADGGGRVGCLALWAGKE
jgi:hypothetical protein